MFREADIVTAEKGEPMRLIDIDAFRKDLGLAERCKECERDARACQYDQIYTRMDFCGWLDDAEIIDAVPVVRCKDCKYSTYFYKCTCPHWDSDQYIYPEVDEDGYCSYGERRSDDE